MAQDVDELLLISSPLLLPCVIQGLGGTRASVKIHTVLYYKQKDFIGKSSFRLKSSKTVVLTEASGASG